MPVNKYTDRNWNEAKAALIAAAGYADIDSRILVKIAGYESNYWDKARPISSSKPELNDVRQFDGVMAMSTAYGYGQCLNGTWAKLIRDYGENYGVENASTLSDRQANDPALRADPKLQAAMLAELTRENLALGAKLGGPNADANVYALHNLGSGDGARFLSVLRNHPNWPISQVLSANVISRNSDLYGDGRMSVADAYSAMGKRMDRYEVYAREASVGLSADNPTRARGVEKNEQLANSQALSRGPLAYGQCGPAVVHLQTMLNDIGYRGADGKSLDVSANRYGPNTQHAVTAFQKAYGLPETGIADEKTLKAVALTQKMIHQDREAHLDGNLDRGDRGVGVNHLQRQLNALGYVGLDNKPLDTGTNLFGPNTEHAVKQFQQSHGLPTTGVADQRTLDALEKAKDQVLITSGIHPDNKLYEKIKAKCDEKGGAATLGLGNEREYKQALATMTYEAKMAGMTNVDHVVPSTNGRTMIVMQVNPATGDQVRAVVDKHQAMQQPVEQSTFQLQQDQQRVQQIAQTQPQQPEQQRVAAMTQ